MGKRKKLFSFFIILIICIFLNLSISYLDTNGILSSSVIKILMGISAVVFSLIFLLPGLAYIKSRGGNESNLKKIFIALPLILALSIYYFINYYFIFMR